MKNTTNIIILATLCLLTACNKFEGDVTIPAYLHLDSIAVQQQASNAPSTDAGWYTSDIDAAQIITYFAGDGKETNLGTFELPCHVPVLREGDIEYVRIVPVVKQNGIAQTRIAYTYLNDTLVRGLTLKPQQTTYIGQRDATTGKYWLPVNYKPLTLIGQLAYEPFEALATTILFDTTQAGVEWIVSDSDNARTGNGYLKVTTRADQNSVTFPLRNAFELDDPSKLLYLEMDYHTDVTLRVGLNSLYPISNSQETLWALTLYPRKDWGKIYINLGKLWAQFNHNKTFTLVFSTLNTTGQGGETIIDNLKVITL